MTFDEMANTSPRNLLESSARQLFRRCVQCSDGSPSCPPCASDQICSYNAQTCDACASASCVKSLNSQAAAPSSNSSPAGPIAGGVIGGIVLVGIAVFLVYWFYMRPRKRSWANQQLANLRDVPTPEHQSFVEQRESKRGSTHTVASFKTTGSRASIPIAYIPGVTSRSDANSPDIIPPVPPIPIAGNGAAGTLSPRMNHGTDIIFSSRDLRPESSYTDADPDRRSMAGRSTRSSIAASEYHNDAVLNPMPVQRVMPTKATPISLQSKSSFSDINSPSRSPTATPPLSHQSSIQRTQGPITGQTGQARQILITRSSSNMRNPGPGHMNAIAELDDTSTGAPTPRIAPSELDDTSVGSRTPKLGFDRSGTASPRSMLSDDAEDLMREGRWRRPSGAGFSGLRSPDPNNPPVSAAGQSTFSRGSPVSAMGWDPNANIRNTIQNAANLAYGNNISSAYGSHGSSIHNDSPFADRHAMNG